MRLRNRSIPWKSISIPWIRRSKGWKFPSKATFQMKMEANLRHIVAKMGISALLAAGRRMDMLENEVFLIFAYLRAKERALENNRFSVLKFYCAAQPSSAPCGGDIRCIETRFIASLTARMTHRGEECRSGAAPRAGEMR